jgi:hypothetical protein
MWRAVCNIILLLHTARALVYLNISHFLELRRLSPFLSNLTDPTIPTFLYSPNVSLNPQLSHELNHELDQVRLQSKQPGSQPPHIR